MLARDDTEENPDAKSPGKPETESFQDKLARIRAEQQKVAVKANSDTPPSPSTDNESFQNKLKRIRSEQQQIAIANNSHENSADKETLGQLEERSTGQDVPAEKGNDDFPNSHNVTKVAVAPDTDDSGASLQTEAEKTQKPENDDLPPANIIRELELMRAEDESSLSLRTALRVQEALEVLRKAVQGGLERRNKVKEKRQVHPIKFQIAESQILGPDLAQLLPFLIDLHIMHTNECAVWSKIFSHTLTLTCFAT